MGFRFWGLKGLGFRGSGVNVWEREREREGFGSNNLVFYGLHLVGVMAYGSVGFKSLGLQIEIGGLSFGSI